MAITKLKRQRKTQEAKYNAMTRWGRLKDYIKHELFHWASYKIDGEYRLVGWHQCAHCHRTFRVPAR